MADKTLSIYWFAILFIVAAGIFTMVYVFYRTPYDVRNVESDLMTNQIASCISKQGVIISSLISNSGIQDKTTCNSQKECQQIIGKGIISIANQIKNQMNLNVDDSIKSEGVAENFECLVAQIAMQESSLQHCAQVQQNGNPLYCDGKGLDEIKKSAGDEKSYGVMQINIGDMAHPDAKDQVSFFSGNAQYAIKNVLLQQYNQFKNGNLFSPTSKVYYGWQAAIRGYNGWGSGGDDSYVEHVIAQKNYAQELFPQECSPGTKVQPQKATNLLNDCHLNFNSEFSVQQYYIEINFYDFKSLKSIVANGASQITSKPLSTLFEGNENLKADCEIQNVKNYQKQSECSEKRFYAVDEKNNQYAVSVLSAVRKTEKNVA